MNDCYEIRLIKTENRQTKVWEGTANAQGITIKYGIDGKKLRTQFIPIAQIPNGDSKSKLEELAQVQIQHGYMMSWQGWLQPLRPRGSSPKGSDDCQPIPAKEEPVPKKLKWGIEPPEWFF